MNTICQNEHLLFMYAQILIQTNRGEGRKGSSKSGEKCSRWKVHMYDRLTDIQDNQV